MVKLDRDFTIVDNWAKSKTSFAYNEIYDFSKNCIYCGEDSKRNWPAFPHTEILFPKYSGNPIIFSLIYIAIKIFKTPFNWPRTFAGPSILIFIYYLTILFLLNFYNKFNNFNFGSFSENFAKFLVSPFL